MRDIRMCDNARPSEVFSDCKENNFGIEMQSFYKPNIVKTTEDYKRMREYKEFLSGFKCGKSLHAPFWDLNLGSKTPGIRKTTMDMFNYAYDIAKELGCTEMIVHNGFVPNTSYYEGWVRHAVSFWKEFFADKDDSIRVMVENQCEEDWQVLMMEIDDVNDDRLKICLDVGHAHANSKKSVQEWIENLGDRIGYVHLHDNHGYVEGRPSYLNDEHLGIGKGTILYLKIFHLLGEHCPDAIWALECKLEYVKDSIDNINRWIHHDGKDN